MKRPHRRRLELVAVDGKPTGIDEEVILEALERVVEEDRNATSASLWLRAARGHGRRLGMYDYRDRFNAEDAWRLSLRFPPGGREYIGLHGRGDAK